MQQAFSPAYIMVPTNPYIHNNANCQPMLNNQFGQPMLSNNQMPQQAPQANAVKIDIHNPQAYAGNEPKNDMMSNPYQYNNASFYSPIPQQGFVNPFGPAMFNPVQINNPPQQATTPYVIANQFNSPMPQDFVPAPVLEGTNANTISVPGEILGANDNVSANVVNENIPSEVNKTVEGNIPNDIVPPSDVNITQPGEILSETKDLTLLKQELNNLNKGLLSENPEEQTVALETLAKMGQEALNEQNNDPKKITSLDMVKTIEPEMIDSLIKIIEKDTSNLKKPTDEQVNLRNKIIKGEKVSKEEENLAKEFTPFDNAEINKQYAIFTTAIVQNLVKDAMKKDLNQDVGIKELPAYDVLIENLKSNKNEEVREACVSALLHNAATMNDKEDLKEVFKLSSKDPSPLVKTASEDALKTLNENSALDNQAPLSPNAPSTAAKKGNEDTRALDNKVVVQNKA